MVSQPKSPMPPNLHAAARHQLAHHPRQRVRPQRADVQLHLREQRRAQRHAVQPDAAVLYLPGVGHELCKGVWGG
jgi:hypothetical protein